MSLQDKAVVMLPPYATTAIYTVVKEFEHKGTAKVRLRHPESGSEHAKPANQVRPATDDELQAGHRIDPHKVFEEWFKFQSFYTNLLNQHGDRLFDFDANDQTYRTPPVNIAWLTWQHKEKQLEGQRFAHNVLAQLISKQSSAINETFAIMARYRADAVDVMTDLAFDEIEQAMQGGAQ